MAVLTGLRWGELTKLTWADIDMATGVLRVLRENTKTNAGRRHVLLGEALLGRLQRHRHEQLRRYAEVGPAPTLVFTTQRGATLKQANFHKRVWGAATGPSRPAGDALPRSKTREYDADGENGGSPVRDAAAPWTRR